MRSRMRPYLERGADVNARSILGRTALTYAKEHRDKRVIRIPEGHDAQEWESR
jgi:ankyrin repeat protein